jgi:SAM-dependent methyltransferase
MSEEVRAEQIGYYRQRAAEYDATAYGPRYLAQARIADLVHRLDLAGDVLELAAGTGMWTEALARSAGSVTALDAAPEALEITRRRLRGRAVEFIRADVFDWEPPRRFDAVFFAFWLSHVPGEMFAPFWSLVQRCLTGAGRVAFVDEQPAGQAHEVYVEGAPETAVRRLGDGSVHRIVKVLRGAGEIEGDLARLGWSARVRPVGEDWLLGEAHRAAGPPGPDRPARPA